MAVTLCDWIKVATPVILLMICMFSASRRFDFFPKAALIDIVPNYAPCKNVKAADQFDLCKSEINTAYGKARSACRGYLGQLNSCKQSWSYNPCKTQQSNVEGCVYSVVKEAVDKWSST
jgi:hypothetical protein